MIRWKRTLESRRNTGTTADSPLVTPRKTFCVLNHSWFTKLVLDVLVRDVLSLGIDFIATAPIRIFIIVIVLCWSSLTETRSVVAKTTRDSALTKQIDERQKEKSQDFPHGHERHKDNPFEDIQFFSFRALILLRRLLDAHTASQTAETAATDGRQGQCHGHVADIYRQHKWELCQDAQPMPPKISVIEIRPVAIRADSDRLTVAFEVFVAPALEAHVILTDGTNDVIATLLLADGDPAMTTGLTELEDGRLRWICFIVMKTSFAAIPDKVAVSVDAAKDVLTRRAFDSIGVIVIVALVLVFGCNELITACTRNQRRILQHSLKASELDPVSIGGILHQQRFSDNICR